MIKGSQSLSKDANQNALWKMEGAKEGRWEHKGDGKRGKSRKRRGRRKMHCKKGEVRQTKRKEEEKEGDEEKEKITALGKKGEEKGKKKGRWRKRRGSRKH